MTEQEKMDLEFLKAEVTKKKIDTIDYLRHIVRLTPEEIKHCGYKTIEEACVSIVKNLFKETDKMVEKHIKKYPDEGIRK